MLNNNSRKHFRVPFLGFLILFLVALACGGEEVSPTKVGEAGDTSSSQVEDQTDNTEAVSEEQNTGENDNTSEAEVTTEPEEPDEKEAETELVTYQVGDIISIGDTVMVVLGWQSPSGDDFMEPEEGQKFVVVDVLFVNQGESTSSISSLLQMNLKDDTGQQYDMDIGASMASGGTAPDGEISAGERIRGQVGYQVPEDATGLEFVFDADVFGTGKVFVELGSEPNSVEVPEGLVGEQEQETFAVGDVIEIGDLTLTVNEVSFPEGDDFNSPDEGNKFLVVDVTFENNGTETETISSLLQTSLKDKSGQQYDIDIGASMASGGSTPDGELAPGEKLRGQLGYQIPEDAEGLVFVFDADVFGFGKVLVSIPNQE